MRFLNYISKLMTGLEPATFGTEIRCSNHCEAFLYYGTHLYIINKVMVRQAQGDFWKNPTEVIRTEILHHPGLQDEVTPRYGNRHLKFFNFIQRTHVCLMLQNKKLAPQCICVPTKKIKKISKKIALRK